MDSAGGSAARLTPGDPRDYRDREVETQDGMPAPVPVARIGTFPRFLWPSRSLYSLGFLRSPQVIGEGSVFERPVVG